MKAKLALFLLHYLRFFAQLQLQKNHNATIIGITGSAGKSSAMSALQAVLKNKYRVKVSHKANSESGIPLNILGLSMQDYSWLDWLRVMLLAPLKVLTNFECFDFYLVEMGIDGPSEPKNMSYLLSIVRPQVGIMLNAGAAHSAAFDHLVEESDPKKRREQITDLIAQEKGKLLTQLKSNQLAIVNLDDPRVKAITQQLTCQVVSFGQAKTTDLQLKNTQLVLSRRHSTTTFTFRISNFGQQQRRKHQERELSVSCPDQLLPAEFASGLAAAILFGLQSGLAVKEIKSNLEKNYQVPAGRNSLLPGINDSLILDSSYNASSMREMIALVAELKPQVKGRSLALLGDMRETGQESALLHQQLAKAAAETFDLIFLVGPAMEQYALPVLQKKARGEVIICDNALDAAASLEQTLQKDDLLLVKGSQNQLYLEEAVKALLADPKSAKQVLCRQDDWWLQVKKEFFRTS